MARTTRGKLKENVGGIHNNCEWIKKHITKSLELLPDGYEQLQSAFGALAMVVNTLDEFTQDLYSRI